MPELPTFRLLITGSRSWTDPRLIEQAIYDMARDAAQLGKGLVVVHGKCRKGADQIARDIVERQRMRGWRHIYQDVHPAHWGAPCIDRCRPGHRRQRPNGTDFCPAVGRYRNELMVNLGADACFAFIKDQSPGATHCANAAEAAGIPTTRIVWEKLS